MRRSGILFTLLASACFLAPEQECDLCFVSAVIYGVVTGDDAVPLAGVSVEAITHLGGCAGQAIPHLDAGLVTEATGSYRLRLAELISPDSYCVVLRFTPPDGSALIAVSDTVESLRLRPDWKPELARDSARVDARLLR